MSDSRPNAVAVVLFAVLAGCESLPSMRQHQVLQPDNLAAVNMQLGVEYFRKRDYPTAIEKLNKALELESNYADAHHVLGLVYQRIGEQEQAEEHFKEAISLNPEDSRTLNDFGRFLCDLKRYPEAQQAFQQALANPLYETPERVHANSGECYARAEQYGPAEKVLRAALTADPRWPQALLEMADLSQRQGHPLEARAYLQRFQESSRHTPRSLWLAVRVERELGDRDAVASYSLALKSRFPDSEETR
ncbi:MAG: type IV pilus biogenesis/stability protein PilW, partial [Gammaproteobacteria bacterium]